MNWSDREKRGQDFTRLAGNHARRAMLKSDGERHIKLMPESLDDGRKGVGSGAAWFRGNQGQYSSKSSERKMASAMIAKIPLPLSRHIAAIFYPKDI
jgi:hypothetical protein